MFSGIGYHGVLIVIFAALRKMPVKREKSIREAFGWLSKLNASSKQNSSSSMRNFMKASVGFAVHRRNMVV
jgi:hypothetical protein